MVTAAPLWLVAIPFLVAAVVARWRPANRFVARHYWPSLFIGWLGVALLTVGVFALDGTGGDVAAVAGGPLAGLSFWSRGRDDDWDDEPEGDRPPDPSLDWEEFTRDGGTRLAAGGARLAAAGH